ncbi:hypothetical protein ACOME3_009149 [Neoechinorhynchus agilis]
MIPNPFFSSFAREFRSLFKGFEETPLHGIERQRVLNVTSVLSVVLVSLCVATLLTEWIAGCYRRILTILGPKRGMQRNNDKNLKGPISQSLEEENKLLLSV